jgi:hypothetical protein
MSPEISTITLNTRTGAMFLALKQERKNEWNAWPPDRLLRLRSGAVRLHLAALGFSSARHDV